MGADERRRGQNSGHLYEFALMAGSACLHIWPKVLFKLSITRSQFSQNHCPVLSLFFSLWSGSTCQTKAPRPWWWMSGRQSGRCWTACWISLTVAIALTGLWWKPSLNYKWVSEWLQIISTSPERNIFWSVAINTCNMSVEGGLGKTPSYCSLQSKKSIYVLVTSC